MYVLNTYSGNSTGVVVPVWYWVRYKQISEGKKKWLLKIVMRFVR